MRFRALIRAAIIILLLAAFVKSSEAKWKGAPPTGHGKPLGSHMRPMGPSVIGRFSTPQVFYGHFVKASKPIHMKAVMSEAQHPGMEWTDDYFRDQFGNEMVRVELGKKETRSRKAEWIRFREFLNHYSVRDLYLVHSLSGTFTDLILVPSTLQCGGFQRVLQEAVLWMGRGPFKSVLHYDELDNFLCVFEGTKEVVLIDQVYKEDVEANGFDEAGHFSHVDPDSVDMKAFPQFQNLPWYRVHLAAGDCLYIPYRWYHQVSSYGNRSLALNIWFSHLWWFDDDSCHDVQPSSPLQLLKKFGFASPNEVVRSEWLETFDGIDDDIDMSGFIQKVPVGTKERKKQLFMLADLDSDGFVSWEELYNFSIDKALRLFPDMISMKLSAMDKATHDEDVASKQITSESSESTVLTGGGDTVETKYGDVESEQERDLVSDNVDNEQEDSLLVEKVTHGNVDRTHLKESGSDIVQNENGHQTAHEEL